jgi:hypothetical protein
MPASSANAAAGQNNANGQSIGAWHLTCCGKTCCAGKGWTCGQPSDLHLTNCCKTHTPFTSVLKYIYIYLRPSNPSPLLIDALTIVSQLARVQPSGGACNMYEPLLKSNLLPLIRQLLDHTDAGAQA